MEWHVDPRKLHIWLKPHRLIFDMLAVSGGGGYSITIILERKKITANDIFIPVPRSALWRAP